MTTEELFDAHTPHIALSDGGPIQTWNEYAAVLAEKLEFAVRFRYVKDEISEPVERRLVKVKVKSNKDGDLLITGEDPDRRDQRSFRIDRITDTITVY